jgi:hypothetical protein
MGQATQSIIRIYSGTMFCLVFYFALKIIHFVSDLIAPPRAALYAQILLYSAPRQLSVMLPVIGRVIVLK